MSAALLLLLATVAVAAIITFAAMFVAGKVKKAMANAARRKHCYHAYKIRKNFVGCDPPTAKCKYNYYVYVAKRSLSEGNIPSQCLIEEQAKNVDTYVPFAHWSLLALFQTAKSAKVFMELDISREFPKARKCGKKKSAVWGETAKVYLFKEVD